MIVKTSCSDIIRQESSDLIKYPQLKFFFDTCGEFKNGTLDIDAGVFRAQFSSDLKSSHELFLTLDNHAIANHWRVSEISNMVHVYRKNLYRYPAQNKDDVIYITFNSKINEVSFKWE